MDYRDKVFISVAENLSFSKAANALNISQPAVTRHIKELENHYQTTFFERKGNKIYLTRAGEKLYNALKEIAQHYRNIEFEISQMHNSITGEFKRALQIATTVKLIRALWIVPLSLVLAFIIKNDHKKSIKFPWFILFFVLAILFTNTFPGLQTSYAHFSWLGNRGMVIALFLIGSNISLSEIRKSGTKSFLLGITLWIIIAGGSLFFLTR